ncbi:conserved hypothetical protein [Pedobacter westerhofensis]|uniref:EthD domain-containing protein n=1 Tax=Pedobacter westerhofensis TaxID=425512 RepID=A0A521FN07_9SPHI|nr:EthD family reductase [Pedobacter westerhofensis]SMO96851.1 conserved hypothetical protein [Pedobacter westerhofensis]
MDNKNEQAVKEIKVAIIYYGSEKDRFNKEYFANDHIALVKRSWECHGLGSTVTLFPERDDQGTRAIAISTFRDEAAVRSCFDSPEGKEVMADVIKYTDIIPVHSGLTDLFR